MLLLLSLSSQQDHCVEGHLLGWEAGQQGAGWSSGVRRGQVNMIEEGAEGNG